MPDARVVPPSRVSLIWVAFRRGLGSLGGPFGGTLLLLGAQICLLVATLSLAAIAVRALPWMLDPKVGWGAIAVFAKGLIVVALETSLMIGLPLAAALVASSVSDRGESVACVLVGASPMRLAALCIPSSLALSIAPLVLSIAWGDVRPGVALASMIASARDACSAIDRPVSEVPMTGAAWLCAPGQPPVLALASHSVVRATSVSIADDLRTVAASGVRIDTVIPTSADIVDNPVDVVPDAEPLTSLLQLEHGVPAIHLEVREAVFRGLPTIARPRSLPAVVRAWLVSASAVIGAWSVMTVLLSRLDARRWMAVALGAATSAITLLVLALVERRAPMLAPLVLAAPLIPPAIVVCTTRIRAALRIDRDGSDIVDPMDRSRLLGCFLLLAGCHAQAGFTPDKSASALSGAQCKTTPGQAEIDLMGADASVRAKVASSRAAGPMVVEIKGDGCSSELKVLQCTVVGARLASYAPVTNRTSTIAKDPTELLSNQPVSTTSLMKEVSGQAAVRTDAEMVGVQRLNGIDGMKPIELAGPECSRATHVVSGIYLGGFTMAAGDPRELEKAPRIFGAGAKVAGHAKTLRSEGDASACATALREGKENNACAVPLRLALVSLAERKAMSKQVVEVAMPVDTGVRKSPVDRVPDVALGESGTELAGMTIRVIHTKARTNDADRAAARLQAHGATPQMYEVGDTGNEKYLGVVFLKTAYRDRFPVIASLLQDIEVLTPTIGDDYSYSDGQHVNLWIAK